MQTSYAQFFSATRNSTLAKVCGKAASWCYWNINLVILGIATMALAHIFSTNITFVPSPTSATSHTVLVDRVANLSRGLTTDLVDFKNAWFEGEDNSRLVAAVEAAQIAAEHAVDVRLSGDSVKGFFEAYVPAVRHFRNYYGNDKEGILRIRAGLISSALHISAAVESDESEARRLDDLGTLLGRYARATSPVLEDEDQRSKLNHRLSQGIFDSSFSLEVYLGLRPRPTSGT